MKNVLALLVGAGLLGSMAFVYFNEQATTTYEAQNEPVVVEKEVTVDNLAKRIAEAQEAAEADIKAKAQAEYDALYAAEMNKVKAAVLKEVEDEIEAQRLEVESEITGY